MEETRSPCETAAPLKCCFVHCTLHRGCVTYGHVSGCTDMNINGGQSVKGTPGPHVCKPTTFPLLGCNSWFPSQEVEKEHKMERTRPRHFSLLIITLFAQHKDNLIRTTACRKKNQHGDFAATQQKPIMQCGKCIRSGIPLRCWERANISCLTSRGHVLSLRPLCRVCL